MGNGLQVYWTAQQHLDLAVHICPAVELIVSSKPGVSPGSMQGVTLVAKASKSLASSIPGLRGAQQCNPMGRGALETSKSST